MAVALPENPNYPEHSPHATIFSPCFLLNDNKRAACSLFKIGCPFFSLLLPLSYPPSHSSPLYVIVKAKAETWQATCSSLSPKPNPKSVYSLPCSVAGSSFSSFSFSNSFNCSSPRESALIFADYLKFHFSVSQPKTLRSRARGCLSELRRATCPEESHSSFCSPFSLNEFLAAASNLYSSTATGPDKVAHPILKHPPRSGMDFLLHIFNLS